jgi:sulfate-transporting ATPase
MPNLQSATCRRNRSSTPKRPCARKSNPASAKSWRPRPKLEAVYAAYAEPDADFDKLAEEQARLEAIIATAGADTRNSQLELAADALRLPPWDAKIGTSPAARKRRVALCKLLLSKPDMLLLDEPTNHLDAESVEWLEQFLVRFPGTVVAVTHDRYFLDNAAEWILELDRGHGIPWKGNYSSWLEQKEARLETEEAGRRAHEGDEAGTGMGAQNPKAARPRARRVCTLRGTVQRRIPEAQRNPGDLHPGRRAPGRQGDRVQRNVSKGFGDRLLIDKLSFSVPPGAIVGIIGPNGAGKSTLFRMLTGQDKPDSGEVEIGPRSRSPTSTRAATASTAQDRVRGIAGGADILTVGKYEMPAAAPTSAASTSRAATSRRTSATSPAASAAACTWPRR